MQQCVLLTPEAPVNDGDNYRMTIVVKKFDCMLETLRISKYQIGNNFRSMQSISRKLYCVSKDGKVGLSCTISG